MDTCYYYTPAIINITIIIFYVTYQKTLLLQKESVSSNNNVLRSFLGAGGGAVCTVSCPVIPLALLAAVAHKLAGTAFPALDLSYHHGEVHLLQSLPVVEDCVHGTQSSTTEAAKTLPTCSVSTTSDLDHYFTRAMVYPLYCNMEQLEP